MGKVDPADMLFPRRWQMVFMLVSGVAIAYALRVNISVAAVSMDTSLDWDPSYKGLIFSSFYVGYAIGQIPSAFMTHWYGAKYLFGLSILLASFFTLLFPFVIKQSFFLGWMWRALTGLAASATFPSCYYFYKSWIPVSEKTVMVSTILSGVYLGEILSFSICGSLVNTPMELMGFSVGGWPACFWFFAVIGIVWFPLWMTYGYEVPEDHPYMNPKELAFIRKGQQYNTVAAFDKEQDEKEAVMGFTHMRLATDDPEVAQDSIGGAVVDAGIPKVAMTDLGPLSPGGTRSRKTTGQSPVEGGGHSPPRRIDNSAVATDTTSMDRDDDDCLAQSLLEQHDDSRDRVDSVACSIINDTDDNLKEVARRIPWGHFIRDPVSLTLLYAYFTMSFIGFMSLSEIPSFLTAELNFDIDEAGFLSVAPFFAQLVSAIGFGQLFNFLQQNHGWSVSNVRQASQFICFGGSATCLVICGFMTNVAAAVSFLVFALFFFGATQSGLACSFLDVSPNYSCSLNSLANLVGAIAGILAPLVVTAFTYLWPGAAGWQAVFIFTGALCMLALYFWRRYRPCEVVPWLNAPRPKKSVNYKEWFPWFRI